MTLNFIKLFNPAKIMISISLFFLLGLPHLSSKTIKTQPLPKTMKTVYLYHIVFGGFLNLGQATLSFFKEQENFKVILKVTPSGIAGFLSGYKEEYFEANGKIKNNRILTKSFVRKRKKENKTLKSLHFFNHTQKKIQLTEWEELGKEEKRTKEPKWLDFYVQKDVVASFFDLSLKLYQGTLKENSFSFETLTLGEDKNKMSIYKEKKGKDNQTFKIDLYEFDKKNKKHYGKKTFILKTGKSGQFKSIIVENLFWLGDLVGTLVNDEETLKVTEQPKD
tara:strand:- start:10923 stop:11756 length:834 start_codon:yes stop_codon:yes gene_type:complete